MNETGEELICFCSLDVIIVEECVICDFSKECLCCSNCPIETPVTAPTKNDLGCSSGSSLYFCNIDKKINF